MAINSTIQQASYTRVRQPQGKGAQVPYQQRKQKAEERERTQLEIDAAVDEWFASTTATANRLAEKFNKKPRYFLDMFFHGGARMLTHHDKVNSHNAFISLKAKELREDGNKMNLLSIQRAFKDEYDAMDTDQLDKVVEDFRETVQLSTHIRRPSPRGRVQDVNNVARNMKMLFSGLRDRVGVEGFFCIVRNTSDYYIEPIWYFTCEALASYMNFAVRKKWDAKDVGFKLEAFAIAGCDPINLFTSGKKKAEYLKGAIRDKLSRGLVAITGNPKATMNYAHFEEEIVHRYGIVLEGWTYEKFINPSELSSSLPGLTQLHDALESGTCKFVKLSPEEKKLRLEKYQEKLTSGDIEPFQRKRRCDAGLKRSHYKRAKTGKNGATQGGDDDYSDDDIGAPKSKEFINSDDDCN